MATDLFLLRYHSSKECILPDSLIIFLNNNAFSDSLNEGANTSFN